MTKSSKKQAILIILTLTLGLGLFGCGKRPEGDININQNPDINTNTEKINTSDWNIYKNEEYGFEVKYPRGWEFKEAREGNKVGEESIKKPASWIVFDVAGLRDGKWDIQFFRKSDELENDIALIGNQFNDRKEYRKNVEFNNINALHVTITTERYPWWISKSVYFSKDNILFRIGNGADRNAKFDYFYKSFRFVE